MTVFTGLVILALILINALYVAAEFGSVGAQRSRIRRLSEEGNRYARRLLPVLEDGRRLDEYIGACQIGITLSSLVLGAYGQATLSERLVPFFEGWNDDWEWLGAQTLAAGIVLLGLGCLQVVLGELVPKALAFQHPTRVALATVLPMRWSLRLFAWFLTLLNGSAIVILKALRLPQTGHRHIHSPEEIELLIAESRDGGLLEPDEHRRLHRALNLRFRTARELMVPWSTVRSLDVDTPPDEALAVVTTSPYTRLPVFRGSPDNVIGLLHVKDLVLRRVANDLPRSLADILRPIVRVHGEITADQLLGLLRDRRSHQAVVTGAGGHVEGLITFENVLDRLFGGMADDGAAGGAAVERLPDGRVRLPGRLRLEDAAGWIGARWRGRAETVGGHVAATLGRTPVVGDRVTIDGVQVEIERVDDRAVARVVVTPRRVIAEAERG